MYRSPPSLHLVGAATSPRAEAGRIAGLAAQLGGRVRHSPDLAIAAGAPQDGIEVLVLLDAQPEDFKTAFAARDQRGLPRWAVVPAEPEDEPAPGLPPAEWHVPRLTRSIHSALSLLELRRENARLRGDLCTVGRRLTHDLRTPLNSISTANDALVERAAATDPGFTLHGSIATAVEETGDLIERVGSVLFASARPMERRMIDMEEVVWNARQRLDADIRAAGATIVSPANWPRVGGASALLELVWANLLANSIRHGGPAPRIELGWKPVDAHTCFWIRDSGPGVPMAKRPSLFHPLDRLNELNAPRGYGLSLVHRAVELHFGTVGYEADPPPGGRFFFTLP